METRYPIRAAAKITGLSVDTLRAWERRYQAVVPERTERGRQYGASHIERLLLLSRLVQNGHPIGVIASLADEDLKDLLVQPASPPVRGPAASKDLLAPILSALKNFDAARAGDELNRLAAILSPRELVYQIALPLMREVGNRWNAGTFTISQEHLVSQILRNLLGSMMRLLRPSSPTMRMVVATPAGESHEFGIIASAMLASLAGIEVIYLGADLPAREIADAAGRVSACVILLGVTVLAATTSAEVREIAAEMPEGAELWVGGAGSAGLDLNGLGRKTVLLQDFPAFESECRNARRN